MNCVILCAGFATRMYPLTRNFPKPLLEVAGKPVLDYLLEQVLVLPGMEDVHIVSNEKFYGHFREWHRKKRASADFGEVGVHIHNDGCRDNETRLGAAADLLLGLKKIAKPGAILVSGGDNIFRFPLSELHDVFTTGNRHLIASLFEDNLEKLKKTGVLELSQDDRVIRLHEKVQEPPSTWISPPLYFFQPSVQTVLEKFLETDGNHDAPGYFIDYLSRREPVQAMKVRSGRFDIGCLESFREADIRLKSEPLYMSNSNQVIITHEK